MKHLYRLFKAIQKISKCHILLDKAKPQHRTKKIVEYF